jgi:LmbE family N-acetylglucosaminyl deacetylase
MTKPFDLRREDRVLLIAPHPDDETLAAGGLLQRAIAARATLRVLFVTDGENNPWAQRATERRWRIGPQDRERWGARRRLEALAALACLGVGERHVEFLGFPDQGLTRALLSRDDDLIEVLAQEIDRFRPTRLVVPAFEDLHPDHSALSVVLGFARQRLRTAAAYQEHQFVVHHDGPVPRIAESMLALSAPEMERKRQAIRCHASQLTLRAGELLGFAERVEAFYAPRPAAENRDDHPVRRAFIEEETLHLDLERRVRPGAFGRSDLVIALAGPEGERRTLTARLPRGAGAVDLVDPAHERLVARGLLQRQPRGERVILPAAAIGGWPHVFVKLERRFGFFDEAGWRAVPHWTAEPLPVPIRPSHVAESEAVEVER